MVEGIDVDNVTAWLVANVSPPVGTSTGGPPIEPPLSFELVAGGRSNLTYLVTDAAGRRVVLRRPPISHVLATAHDMTREHRIISALAGSDVPVPMALGLCVDESVNDRPFYVMNFVEGHILRTAPEVEAALDEKAQRVAGEDLVDVLSRLHDVDVDAVGLGELGRRDGYLERQLKRWYGQFQRSQEQAQDAGVFRPAPVVDEVHALLVDAAPPQQGVAIVHGDYRLDNTVIGDDGRVRAVLDWELCTLGDPLADVGMLLAYWTDRDDPDVLTGGAATTAPGMPSRAELAELYAARSRLDLSALPYYIAFAYWKLACIVEGVYVRYASGAMGVTDEGLTSLFADMVVERAERARAALL
jgi:aminoglycoside phosphotransferase (APT) family kinase protein